MTEEGATRAGVICPRCGESSPFDISKAVTLTVHYEHKHRRVGALTMAAEIVKACS